jgi:cobalamin biosynthesis protein CbiG
MKTSTFHMNPRSRESYSDLKTTTERICTECGKIEATTNTDKNFVCTDCENHNEIMADLSKVSSAALLDQYGALVAASGKAYRLKENLFDAESDHDAKVAAIVLCDRLEESIRSLHKTIKHVMDAEKEMKKLNIKL